MPGGRPKFDLDEFQGLIKDAWQAGLSIDNILLLLNDKLSVRDQSCARRTLARRLVEWEFEKRLQRVPITEELINRVRYYFFKYGYSDSSILRDLRQDGFEIGPSTLKVIRWQNGMKRRFYTDEERDAALGIAHKFLEDDLQRSAAIKGFGRGWLYHYVRLKAGVLVSQNRLYEYYRQQHPDEVRKRREGCWKHRKEFSVPGPNFLWSLDGYDKLKNFGFQVCENFLILYDN